jgi:Uri superfamily endonuclease
MVPLKRDNIVFYLNQSVYAYAGWTHGGLKNRIKAKKKKKKKKERNKH